MARALLIAEKKSAMEEIRAAYNKIKNKFPYDIDFVHAQGHLITLCEPNEYKEEWGTPWNAAVLPMIPSSFKKKVIESNKKIFFQIKSAYENGNYDYIINAGDAGREGQLIQMLIYEAIGVSIPILRYWADDNTEKSIITALYDMKPNDAYQGLTNAAFLRQYFDWLVGMNFSRSASLSLKRTASLGRVMTSTLAMIVNRDDEIHSFIPKDYYELEATFITENSESYKGRLINQEVKEGNIFSFENKEILENISLSDKGQILEVNQEDKTQYAPTLYSLTDLQKDCATKFKYSPAKTLEIAQRLYEKKFLSYPRTESKHLSFAKKDEMKDILLSIKAVPSLSNYADEIMLNPKLMNKVANMKKYFNDAKISDHPALSPTSEKPIFDDLDAEEKNVYELVCRRIIAIYMPPYQTQNTTLITQVDSYKFKSCGIVVKESGWKSLYKEKTRELLLPVLQKEAIVTTSDTVINCKKTVPPANYNNATILTAMETAGKQLDDKELEKVLMECAGLGTPATRSEILKKLEHDNYIKTEKNNIVSTEEGMQLIHALGDCTITSPELTAKWEKKLKDVEKGACDYDSFYAAMVNYITYETASLSKLQELGPYIKKIGSCRCGRTLIEGSKYFFCEGFTTKDDSGNRLCNAVFPKSFGSAIITAKDVLSLLEKGSANVNTRQQGAKAKLTYSETGKLAFTKSDPVGVCPKCGGDVRAGKNGFYCENAKKDDNGNQKCNFSIYKLIGKTLVTEALMKEILSNNGISKKARVITWQSGKKFTGLIQIAETNGKYGLRVVAGEKKSKNIICKCPFCEDGEIYKTTKTYSCTNHKIDDENSKCNFWVYNSIYKTAITKEEIKLLLEKNVLGKKVKTKSGGTRNIIFELIHNKQDNTFSCKEVSN